jgi:hypothetical protein
MKLHTLSFLCVSFSTLAGPSDSTAWQKKDHPAFTFSYQDTDQKISNEIDHDVNKEFCESLPSSATRLQKNFKSFFFLTVLRSISNGRPIGVFLDSDR